MDNCILNHDVLHRVLEYATAISQDNLDTWEAILPLIAVCRQWRYIGLPLFSKSAILVYRGDSFSSKPKPWHTNIGIITESKNISRIREVIIKISWQDHTPHVLNTLFNYLPIGQGLWANVQVLGVVSDKEDGPLIFSHPIARVEQQSESPIDEVAAKIAAHLPNVHRLYFLGKDAERCGSKFVQQLSAAYGTRLRSFSGNLSALEKAPTQLTQLTKLEITVNGDSNVERLPYICPETLKYLKLTDVFSDAIWQRFANSDDGMAFDAVLFSNLEHLFISYKHIVFSEEQANAIAGNFNKNDYGFKLHFPKLRCLDVENCPPGSLLLDAEITSTLKHVRIEDFSGRLELAKLLSRHKDIIDTVAVSTYIPVSNANVFYSATSQIFGGNCCAKYTSLTLYNSAEILDLSRVNWTQLTKLSVFAEMRAIDLINLISRLPSLAELALSGVNMEGWDCQRLCKVIEGSSKPISTTITKIYYGDIFITSGSDTTEFLQYLLLAVPNVAEFAFSNKHFSEMLKFVQTLGHQSHPHLFQIRYDILC